jgi:hypothetical protein
MIDPMPRADALLAATPHVRPGAARPVPGPVTRIVTRMGGDTHRFRVYLRLFRTFGAGTDCFMWRIGVRGADPDLRGHTSGA